MFYPSTLTLVVCALVDLLSSARARPDSTVSQTGSSGSAVSTSTLGWKEPALAGQTTTQRGAFLARRLGLHLLDEDTLRRREASNSWLRDRFAHIGGEACRAVETRTDTQLGAIAQIPSMST